MHDSGVARERARDDGMSLVRRGIALMEKGLLVLGVEGPERIPVGTLPPLRNRRQYQRRTDAERKRIVDALREHAYDRSKTSKALGIARRSFYRLLTDYGLLEASPSSPEGRS